MRSGSWQKRAVVDFSAEEPSPGVGDNFTCIVTCHQTASHQFIEAELFGAGYFDSAVQRTADADVAQHAGDVIASDRLNQNRRHAHGRPVGG